MPIPRWLLKNGGSLFLAFMLALLVWAAAINESDPLVTQEFSGAVAIEFINIEPGNLLTGEIPQEGTMVLRAPTTVWEQLAVTDLHLVIDLSDLEEGSYSLEVSPVVDLDLVRVVSFEPTSINLMLEPSRSHNIRVSVVRIGDPAIGFSAEDPVASPDRAVIEGPSSSVLLVEELRALVDIAGRSEDVNLEIELVPLDAAGEAVEGVNVSPATINVRVPIVQQSGFRSVAVKPIIQGSPASGYWVTDVTYTPTAVTLVSSDPQALDLLPGYIETEPLVLTGASETIEQSVLLTLPVGITVFGDPNITLVVTIEALETSITITRTLEILSLEPGYAAQASPDTVNVFLKGPQPTLEGLQPDDVRVVLDLQGYEPGVHQIVPEVLIRISDVEVQTVLPESVEVTITELATATPEG